MTENTTNLSKIKREHLLEICSRLKNNESVERSEINELEQFIRSMKYGLLFEEHQEQIDVDLLTKIPIFIEDIEKKLSFSSDYYNFLLEGDNLHSLKLLEKTHKNSIDVIYIDPPYNTGNKDFIYNDKIIGSDDGYRHSKWLSFMKERLEIARNLLVDEGVIFISIDDNEQAQLKLLCNEVFGEDNCLATICVELSKTQGMKVKSAQNGSIVKNHEYIHVYCKDINYACQNRKPLYDKSEAWDNHFNCILLPNKNNTFTKYEIIDYIKDYHPDIYTLLDSLKLISNGKLSSKNIEKGILLNSEIENFFYRTIAHCIYQQMACSIQVPNDILVLLKSNNIVAFDKYILEMTSGNKIRQYRNLAENLHDTDEYFSTYARSTIRGALWKGFYSDMMNVQKEGSIDFKNGKKPIRLMKQLIKWVNRFDATVLDFFAGSGTTGHAVLELNQEDGGNRKFILCTNNENNICEEVTYQRLKTVITGIRADGTKYSDGIPANLKYFKAEFIDKDNEDLDEELLDASIQLIELENFEDVNSSNATVFVAENDDELDEFENRFNPDSNTIKKIYVAEDVCLSASQSLLFEKYQIKIKTIPTGYFKEI